MVQQKASKIWIITDTHFGHRKLEELAGRPKDFEHLIWNNLKVIQPEDIVIHLGDICIGNDEQWHGALRAHLPTQKLILVKGNHDSKSNSWYYRNGWDFVCDSLSDYYFGKYVTFSHAPITDIKNINIHGHLHDNGHRMDDDLKEKYNPDLHKLIALETNGYKPELLMELLDKYNGKV